MLLRTRSPAMPRTLLCTLGLLACLAVPAHAQLPTLGDGSDMAAGAERRLGRGLPGKWVTVVSGKALHELAA